MKRFKTIIEGITPLLMDSPQALFDTGIKKVKRDNQSPEEIAEGRLYKMHDVLYTPATHILGSLINAGKMVKLTGKGSSRATYSKVVGYSVDVEPMEIEHKIQKWEVRSDIGVNPNTKGRQVIHRPMLREWKLEFTTIFDEDEIEPEVMKELLTIAGKKVGIGTWRPEKKGRFGKFQLVEWKEL